jgi:hypothetical protein
VVVGIASRFGRFVYCSLDSSMIRPIGGIFANWESIMDGWIQIIVSGEKITTNQTLIAK